VMKRTSQLVLAFLVTSWLCPRQSGAAPTGFDSLLGRTTALVSALLEEFSDVKCTERVTQEKLGKNGKVEYKENSTYDYLVILANIGGELTLDESRVEQLQSQHKKQIPLLVTNGFAMGFLVFHPHYANSFEFRDEGDEPLNGRVLRKVHFRHVRGTRSIMALSLRGREYPLELEGDAWIDSASGAITRMLSVISIGIEDLGLRTLRSEVEYAPVSFGDAVKPFWLPVAATIEVATPRQHWRNIHRFSDYKRFSVSTEEKVNESTLKQ